MLDLNTIEITKLIAEFSRNRFVYIFLGIAIYVKTFKRYVLLESDRMFTSNQGRLLRETEQDFNDFVNTNWLKHNAVYIEDGVVEIR